MRDLVACPTCGATRRLVSSTEGTSHFASAEGTHPALAEALDPYHAANLREVLQLVPDTGDWHGSLRIACDMVLDKRPQAPNMTAERMVALGLVADAAASSKKQPSDVVGGEYDRGTATREETDGT